MSAATGRPSEEEQFSRQASEWWQSISSTAASADTSATDLSEPSPNTNSWQFIFQVLTASIKASSQHLQSLTWSTLALGWVPVMKAHEQLRDLLPGTPIMDRQTISQLLQHANWSRVAYGPHETTQDVLQALEKQGCEVLSLGQGNRWLDGAKGVSASNLYLPAYFLAVDHGDQAVRLVVRGTMELKDLVTDLAGHTEPFLTGHAHCGVLRCARAVLNAELDRLSQAVQANAGYRVELLGHSLGGGVACVLACMLNHVPELKARMHGAPVTATTYATPPVVTKELAESSAAFITTIVNKYDMIPRLSLATLSELHQQLEAAKEQMVGNSREQFRSLAEQEDLVALKNIALEYVLNKPTQAVASLLAEGAQASPSPNQAGQGAPSVTAAMQQAARAAGLSVDSTASLGKVFQKALSIASSTSHPSITSQALSPTAATTAPSAATGSIATQSRSLPITTSHSAPLATSASPVASVTLSSATLSAAASKMAVAKTTGRLMLGAGLNWLHDTLSNKQSKPKGTDTPAKPVVSVTASSQSLQCADANTRTSIAPPTASQSAGNAQLAPNAPSVQPAAPAVQGSVPASVQGCDGSAVEDQKLHRLYCPGRLLHLQKEGSGPAARRTLVQGCVQLDTFQRLLLKKSMLKDHRLPKYIEGLEKLRRQWGRMAGLSELPPRAKALSKRTDSTQTNIQHQA